MNEQWLTDGICSQCRRKGYCTNGCKKHTERIDRIVKEAVMGHPAIQPIIAINSMLEKGDVLNYE